MTTAVSKFPKSVQPGIPKLSALPEGWTRFEIGDLFDVVQRPVTMDDETEYDLVTVKRSRGGLEVSGVSAPEIGVAAEFFAGKYA